MPDYINAWYLQAATPMLARSTFIPNHPEFGRYNGILFKALEGVETGRLSPEEAIEFLEDEMTNELGDSVLVVESLG
jgi:inositol-phosphate transport system substrate-binding protein